MLRYAGKPKLAVSQLPLLEDDPPEGHGYPWKNSYGPLATLPPIERGPPKQKKSIKRSSLSMPTFKVPVLPPLTDKAMGKHMNARSALS